MGMLWGRCKDTICANKQYVSLDGQVAHFGDYVNGLSDERVLQTFEPCLNIFAQLSVVKEFLFTCLGYGENHRKRLQTTFQVFCSRLKQFAIEYKGPGALSH